MKTLQQQLEEAEKLVASVREQLQKQEPISGGQQNGFPKYWYVKNDGSQLFKDTVIKYINKKGKKDFIGTNGYYGYNGKYDWCSDKSYFKYTAKELTIQEFIILQNKYS